MKNRFLQRAEDRGAFDATRVVSAWLASGPPLWLAWLFTHDASNDDSWETVGVVWISLSNLVVLSALAYSYWVVRASHRIRGLPPFHFKLGPGYFLIPLSFTYGIFATIALVREVDGEPPPVFVLTAATLLCGLTTEADWYFVLRRRGRQMRRIEEAYLDDP